jgi:hypothetical protein
MLQVEGDPEVHHVYIHEDKPAYLKYDFPTIAKHFPQLIAAKQQLIEQCLASDLFLPAREIDAQAERRIQQVLSKPILIPAPHAESGVAETNETSQNAEAISDPPNPFDRRS